MIDKPCLLFVLVLLALLPACNYRQVCTDPSALNYTNADPEIYESNPGLCKYGPAVKLAGNWTYTDTFTYYPPLGGTPQTSYTPPPGKFTVYRWRRG